MDIAKDITAQGIQHIEVWQRQHLPGIFDMWPTSWQPQRADQSRLAEGADAGRAHPAQVFGRPVGDSKVQCLKDSLA
jgi:hypothetical protein